VLQLHLTAILMAGVLIGCAARYHTVHDKNGGESAGGDPAASADQTRRPAPPSAAVEVIDEHGSSVRRVAAGRPFTVQPTKDSRDGDDPPSAACRNPGLRAASYTFAGGSPLASSGAGACPSLAVSHQLPDPGVTTIVMVVTSDEGETAEAMMTLAVYDPAQPEANDSGLTISAEPMSTRPGEPVSFSGDCAEAAKIEWDFGDGSEQTGASVVHAFATAGPFTVVARCPETQGDGWLEGKLTVVVTERPEHVADTGNVPPTGPATGPGEPADGDGGVDAGVDTEFETGGTATATHTSTSTASGGNGNSVTSTSTATSTNATGTWSSSGTAIVTSTASGTSSATSTDTGGTDGDDDQDPDDSPGQTPQQGPGQN
jgi:hypothetical protein